jgi:hypothetical protein
MKVLLVSDSPEKMLIVPLGGTSLPAVRKALPGLKQELGDKWQIESVSIKAGKARLKNPSDIHQTIVQAGVYFLVIRLLGPSLDVVGKDISKHVHRWLKKFDKTKKKKRRKTA